MTGYRLLLPCFLSLRGKVLFYFTAWQLYIHSVAAETACLQFRESDNEQRRRLLSDISRLEAKVEGLELAAFHITHDLIRLPFGCLYHTASVAVVGCSIGMCNHYSIHSSHWNYYSHHKSGTQIQAKDRR